MNFKVLLFKVILEQIYFKSYSYYFIGFFFLMRVRGIDLFFFLGLFIMIEKGYWKE